MQYYQKVRPIIAAHRGLSSLYPENTLEGFKSALQFSDFIELDVVLNRDRLPIVCHDAFLSLVNDVKKHYKFENRKKIRLVDSDFTLEELKELRLTQCINNRKSEYDGHLKIPSLKETVEYFLKYNQKIDNKKGILLEIKDYDYHQQYCNINIAEIIFTFLKEQGLSTLRECSQKLPIVIMSFEKQILQYFNNNTDLPLTQLVCLEDKNIPTITEIAQYAKIIGLDLRLVWENNQTHQYYNEAKENGLIIYGWTFQDDSDDLKKLFNEQDVGKIYQKSSTLLQGIITEFPQEAVKFIL
ncbi:unnamed protein product (macronuclear) [Paramecium tetraurelia]|uniref:glycerophosphodiester phosphodiesterase n=1 Tax=Paramecium tetraurelia TaxID=5888 RepID=A0D4I4_PARTE|nr:uncharacterized protein GSPATT00013417001 [Paramecium tetraurelia]CAK77951.1 unnamed protein product [Paramecium tetraurelia]|eukprot:XP_001445348.1 hypothetical protein (macronuclear) [Paramecium tetraurelia strain d4-2]